MARINRAARPTRLTAADKARQAAAVAEWDRRVASARRRERVAMFATWAVIIGGGLALFYIFTGA